MTAAGPRQQRAEPPEQPGPGPAGGGIAGAAAPPALAGRCGHLDGEVLEVDPGGVAHHQGDRLRAGLLGGRRPGQLAAAGFDLHPGRAPRLLTGHLLAQLPGQRCGTCGQRGVAPDPPGLNLQLGLRQDARRLDAGGVGHRNVDGLHAGQPGVVDRPHPHPVHAGLGEQVLLLGAGQLVAGAEIPLDARHRAVGIGGRCAERHL